jgi:hypothetical protein
MLVQGEGIPANESEGFKFLSLAAEYGETSAVQSVGAILARHGGQKNYREALKWYLILNRSNPVKAGQVIEMLERQLSAGEIADAEKAAKAWSPKNKIRRGIGQTMSIPFLCSLKAQRYA